MTRTKIPILIAAVFTLTFTVHEAHSASFNAVGALKQSTVSTQLTQEASGCHTNCRWWYINKWSCQLGLDDFSE